MSLHFFFFFGNHRVENFRVVVADIVQSYNAMRRYVSLKVKFLDCYLDVFAENFVALSDECGELFRQDISTMEKRYQGKWIPSILVDYCWTLRTDVSQAK